MLVCVFMAMAVLMWVCVCMGVAMLVRVSMLMGVFVLMGVPMLMVVLVSVIRVLEGRYQLLAVLMCVLRLIVAPAKPGDLDRPHRVLVLQIGATRLLGIGIVLRERIQARLHALAVELEALCLGNVRHQEPESYAPPRRLDKRLARG